MKDGKGLLKTAGVFGFLLAASRMIQRRKSAIDLKKEKKKTKKAHKKMKAAFKEMEKMHACPPVRIPVDPHSRN